MVSKCNNVLLKFNNFYESYLNFFQDKSSTLRINFLLQKKYEESHNLLLQSRMLSPSHLHLFLIDDIISFHNRNTIHVARIVPKPEKFI